MASLLSLTIVLAAVTAGSVRGQMAPAPAPAVPGTSPLGISLATPTVTSQLSASPIFGSLLCYSALNSVYDQYTFTGNWSQVVNIGDPTDTTYVACHSYTPDNVNASVVLLHPFLPVGKTIKDLLQSGSVLLFGSLTNIFHSAEAVGARDDRLFYAQYPSAGGSKRSKAELIKHVLGRVVLAKALGDTNAVCVCPYETVPIPANAPSQQVYMSV
ncbi:hypothetical protein COCOBI_16-4030 [Coccomyxa sp. Obi]|nr:hypothetical protein COCOBI_16-4030 [Coccomyxa sp. Obi]